VRLDHSGTTHIFKEYLTLINAGEWEAEAYPEEIGGKKTGCGAAKGPEKESWAKTASECENQRWPLEAEIVRGTESGNPGVVKRVNEVPGSIGYADLAVARKEKFFSEKGLGGENVKGTGSKQGEQKAEYWAPVQNTAEPATELGYADPSSTGDVTAASQSNCAGTVFTEVGGKKFPPATTREAWNEAKAELAEKKYAICGLTYDLALRELEPYTGETFTTGKEAQTTVRDYLRWAVNAKAEGGGAFIKASDYEKLPSNLVEESEDGLEELGWKVPGVSK
jgi:ABC-type phosphate transport system substrate-binding protein